MESPDPPEYKYVLLFQLSFKKTNFVSSFSSPMKAYMDKKATKTELEITVGHWPISMQFANRRVKTQLHSAIMSDQSIDLNMCRNRLCQITSPLYTSVFCG